MNYPIAATEWYKASDGTQAVDMQVKLITRWHRPGPKDVVSFMAKTPDGPIGAYTLEFSDGALSGLAQTASACYAPNLVKEYPTDLYYDDPDQPAGAGAVVTALDVESLGEYARGVWTPTAGSEAAGAGHLPTEAAFAYTQDIEQ